MQDGQETLDTGHSQAKEHTWHQTSCENFVVPTPGAIQHHVHMCVLYVNAGVHNMHATLSDHEVVERKNKLLCVLRSVGTEPTLLAATV